MKQKRIMATYMRGGTSKGVFFRRSDLPHTDVERDRVLLRAIGSPDPYRQHIDGMGGATSRTSKVESLYSGHEAESSNAPKSLFPTGSRMEKLDVLDIGCFDATLTTAGNPTVLVLASQLGLHGNEGQPSINTDAAMLAKLEAIRVCGAVRMGMARNLQEAAELCLHTPKVCFVGMPSEFVAASGRVVPAAEIDLNARIVSMGKLHHAMTGTGAIALSVAAATPGTLVSQLLDGARSSIRFGHASGSMRVGAEGEESDGTWRVTKVMVSRSARRLMEGSVFVPAA